MSENDLIVAETLRADVVFVPGGVDVILEKLERDVRAVRTDISTKAGRSACASLARKVASSKTALDDLGKGLVADWKLRSALVDAERRRIRDRLDALRDEVRRPLTEWEEAEKRRVEGHEAELARMLALYVLSGNETSEEISNRLDSLERWPTRDWHEFTKRAGEVKDAVWHGLTTSLGGTIRRETERAELTRLRAEAAEREQRERDEQLRREAAEKARAAAEAEAREAARVQAAREAAERARVDRERVAAEEARRRAEAAAEQAKFEAEAAAQQAERARVAAKEKAKRDAEAAVEAERRRAADERAAAEAEAARREADEQNKERVHQEIVDDLVRRQFNQKQARAVVAALATGTVPHVRIAY